MNQTNKWLLAPCLLLTMTACQAAGGYDSSDRMGGKEPGGDYKKVSELVDLPEFIPGMGQLYVQPDTLPAGPFLAYDRNGDLASTIYMIPLEGMNAHGQWNQLATTGHKVQSVDITYNPGHPGVNEPHYHVTLWHVTKQSADL